MFGTIVTGFDYLSYTRWGHAQWDLLQGGFMFDCNSTMEIFKQAQNIALLHTTFISWTEAVPGVNQITQEVMCSIFL